MTLFKHIRAILALPFNVLIVIPALLFVFANNKLILSNLPLVVNITRYSLSFLFFILGLFLVIANIITFHRMGKGTLAPWDPPKKLVVVGMYRY